MQAGIGMIEACGYGSGRLDNHWIQWPSRRTSKENAKVNSRRYHDRFVKVRSIMGQEQASPLQVESHGCATGAEQPRDHTGVVVEWAFPPFRSESSNEKRKTKSASRGFLPEWRGFGNFTTIGHATIPTRPID